MMAKRRSSYGWSVLALLVCLGGGEERAAGQVFPVCGDADGNERVTVNDGVQVLRSAAGLSSGCTLAICDIDVDGRIGITDGVVVLRKAAGLSLRENCIPDEGAVPSQVEHLVQRTQPLVTEALGIVVERRATSTDESFRCRNGGDGTYDVTFADGILDGSFIDCLAEDTLINGDVESANRNPILGLELADRVSEESVAFEGSLRDILLEDGVKYSGNLSASPFFDTFETGDFLVVLSSVVVGGPAIVVAGSLTLVLDEDSNVPEVTRVQLVYDGSNLARVQLTMDDGTVTNHKYDLVFREFL